MMKERTYQLEILDILTYRQVKLLRLKDFI